jgi:hypothetical protein
MDSFAADVARALSALDADLAEVLVDYGLNCYAPDIVRTGIRSLDDLGRRLWQGDDKMFGEPGHCQVSLLIVRAVLGHFRHGFDVTLDLEDELYALLKEHKHNPATIWSSPYVSTQYASRRWASFVCLEKTDRCSRPSSEAGSHSMERAYATSNTPFSSSALAT